MSKIWILIFVAFLLFSGIGFAADSDGDGLSDSVEVSMRSNPRHKDIYVYITPFIWKGKNMAPREGFSTIINDFFSSAPVDNPDGKKGIKVHLEIGPSIRTNVVPASWDQFDAFKNQYLPASKRNTHHYCLFTGQINFGGELSMSGISRNDPAAFRRGASDFIVSLGDPGWWNTPSAANFKWTQAGTFIHELGHNLGLTHGGIDNMNYKPNYFSVMNYNYQTNGVPVTVTGKGQSYLFDYSRFISPNLYEHHLNEIAGLGPTVNRQGTIYGARWLVTESDRVGKETFDATSNVDWDNDGTLESDVRFNLNNDKFFSQVTGGGNDWNRLYFYGGQIGQSSALSNSAMSSEFLNPCMKVSDRPMVALSAAQNIPRITYKDLLKMRKK